MDQYSTTSSEQSYTLCGRCSQPFTGGPGVPFCPSCILAMQKENGYDASMSQPDPDYIKNVQLGNQ